MWYGVETAFIKGIQYKSVLLFDKKAEPNNKRMQPGTCLARNDERPHNTCQTFLNNEIEIHTNWFQTKEQAEQFKNGGITYVIHEETWYDKPIRSVRSRFIKWETVPALGKYLPFRGVYEYHYRDGRDNMINQLLQELVNAKDSYVKEVTYRNLHRIGIDKETADTMIKEGQS